MKKYTNILLKIIFLFFILPSIKVPVAFAHPSIPMYHLVQSEINDTKINFTINFSPDQVKAYKIFSFIDTNGNDFLDKDELDKWSKDYLKNFKVYLNNEAKDLELTLSQAAPETKKEFVDDPNTSQYAMLIITASTEYQLKEGLSELKVENNNTIDGTDTYGFLPILNGENVSIICQPMPERNVMVFKFSKFAEASEYTCDSQATPQTSSPANNPREDQLTKLVKDIFQSPVSFLLAILIAMFFGMQHALLPGHAKTLVVVMSTQNKNRNHIYLAISTAVSHALSDIALAFLIIWVTEKLKGVINENVITSVLGISTGIIILIMGLFYIARTFMKRKPFFEHSHGGLELHSHDHDHSHPHYDHHHEEKDQSVISSIFIGIVSGLVPSLTAIGVLIYTYIIGQLYIGVILIAGYSIGFSLVILFLALGFRYIRNRISSLSKFNSPKFLKIEQFLAGLLLVIVGIISILSSK